MFLMSNFSLTVFLVAEKAATKKKQKRNWREGWKKEGKNF